MDWFRMYSRGYACVQGMYIFSWVFASILIQQTRPNMASPPHHQQGGPSQEQSFRAVLKEHKLRQAALQREIDLNRREATAAVKQVTSLLLESANEGVKQVYDNQVRLGAEAKYLQNETARFSKHAAKWLAMYKELNNALKELGDVKNWAEIIEKDMLSVADTLEEVVNSRLNAGGSGAAAAEQPQPQQPTSDPKAQDGLAADL